MEVRKNDSIHMRFPRKDLAWPRSRGSGERRKRRRKAEEKLRKRARPERRNEQRREQPGRGVQSCEEARDVRGCVRAAYEGGTARLDTGNSAKCVKYSNAVGVVL